MNAREHEACKYMALQKDQLAINRLTNQTNSEMTDLGIFSADELTEMNLNNLSVEDLKKIVEDRSQKLCKFVTESSTIQAEIKKMLRIIQIKS